MFKTLQFQVDRMELIEEINKSQFAKVKIFAFASGDNAHSRPVSEETLKRSADTIYDKPLVWIFDKYTGDIGGHDTQEVPCGFVHRENNPIEFIRLDDGRLMLSVEAMIWKKYSGKVLSLFERDGMEKPVSVEIQIIEEKENDKGQMEIIDLCYQCITLLGTFVKPAIESARAEILAFSQAKNEYTNHLTFSIPDIVKQNAQKGLLLKKNNSKGINVVELSIANQLISSDTASIDLLNNIVKFSAKSKSDVSLYLLGGTDGINWADNILNLKEQKEFSKKEGEGMVSKAVEKFSLNSDQLYEIFNNAISEFKFISNWGECRKYWINKFNDEFVTLNDEEDGKKYRIPYTIVDNVATLDWENKVQVISGDDVPVGENGENPDDEKTEEMSSDANVDPTATAEMLDKEAEQNKELAEEGKENMSEEGSEGEGEEVDYKSKYEEMCGTYEDMCGKYTQMEADMATYMSENTELKAFKASVEEQQKMATIECTLNEVMECGMPKEKADEFREKATEFSVSDINSWVNLVKATALDFSVKDKKKEGFTRMGLPFAETNKSEKSGSVWSKL